jgi:hypothetical protein
MTEALIDSLPVAQLPDRYRLSRSVVYERLSTLKIEPEKRGNKAYINAEQLALLDSLHAFLQGGGSTADFLASTGLSDRQTDRQTAGQSAELARTDQTAALVSLVEAIAHRLPASAPANPLSNLEALEQAAQNGWLLSTSQLAPLLGLKTLSGKTVQRYGFTFTRVGRNGAESAWSIQKQ